MRNNKKTAALVLTGVFGSLGVGLALIIIGGSTFNFNLQIAGIVVLVVGTILTVAIWIIVSVIKYWHTVEPEPRHIIGEPQKPVEVPKPQNERTVWKLMDKEDAFTSDLELNYKIDLLRQYKAEVEPIWEQYTGDEWDENLQQIDEIIDKYKEIE